MRTAITGIHHVTAITADAQANVDFYCGVLGLRLVKLTVNFDDPQSYHLYYGDELGRPGTIMTFFAWPGAPRGRVGPPQVSATAFAVPGNSLDYWRERLAAHGVQAQVRLRESIISFADPDGLRLELVPKDDAASNPWTKGGVSNEHAIRGFAGVTLALRESEPTAQLLTQVMGFAPAGAEGNRLRYVAGAGRPLGSVVDLVAGADARAGGMGAGVVHHVAFRAADDAAQSQWRERISDEGLGISPVIDRKYFHSIYYREPGGVLFEIATDGPGFGVDEPAAELGSRLMLPEQYEAHRSTLGRLLPKLRLPAVTGR